MSKFALLLQLLSGHTILVLPISRLSQERNKPLADLWEFYVSQNGMKFLNDKHSIVKVKLSM